MERFSLADAARVSDDAGGPSPRGRQVLTTGPQLRAARGMAALTRDELAEASSVGAATITRLERMPGGLPAQLPTLAALQQALEVAGVEFVPNGVRTLRAIPGPRRG